MKSWDVRNYRHFCVGPKKHIWVTTKLLFIWRANNNVSSHLHINQYQWYTVFQDHLDLQKLTDSQRDNSRWFQIEGTKGLTLQEESRKLPPKNDAKEICEHNIWNNNPWLQNLNICFKHSSLLVYEAVTIISKLATIRRRMMPQRSESMKSKTTHRLHRPWRRTPPTLSETN